MTEVRTTSRTGGQKGVKPERYSLIPTKGLAAIARVFGFGAKKYADHNWRRGYEWSKSFDALERHFQAAKDGETYDEESGLPHLAHAGFHILVLLTWLEEQGEGADNPFDDRWPAAMERARREEAAVGLREFLDPELWENVGYVDEDAKFAPFATEDLTKFQEQVNRTVRNLADVMERPRIIVHHAWQPPQDTSFVKHSDAINAAHNGTVARG